VCAPLLFLLGHGYTAPMGRSAWHRSGSDDAGHCLLWWLRDREKSDTTDCCANPDINTQSGRCAHGHPCTDSNTHCCASTNDASTDSFSYLLGTEADTAPVDYSCTADANADEHGCIHGRARVLH
jgi:hypothetical protein